MNFQQIHVLTCLSDETAADVSLDPILKVPLGHGLT